MPSMAVEVINGCKRYGKGPPILDNINVQIQTGHIYGLLGASGCGKTTLLSCIVGIKALDKGHITIFGGTPKDNAIPGPGLGYMPQDISLISMFSIMESFFFFGKVAGLSDIQIASRAQFLAQFLELPDCDRRIGNLSGGQKRRVSLACSIIHRSNLLILDEPTVGVDPVLRNSIWNYLIDLCEKERVTIIITTHYIEEARSCNTVGIMRRGKLLAEDSPEALMKLQGENSLERVVLKLCHEDEDTNLNNNVGPFSIFSQDPGFALDAEDFKGKVELKKLKRLSTSHDHLDRRHSMRHIGRKKDNCSIITALIRKSFIRNMRNPAMIFLQLLLPILQTVVYKTIVGVDPKGLSIGYVSQDWDHFVKEKSLSRSVSLQEYCRITGGKYGTAACLLHEDERMSSICAFFNEFQPDEVTWVHENSTSTALTSVQLGNTMGFLEIPFNFTYHLKERLLLRQFSGNDTLKSSTIKISEDITNTMSVGWLNSILLKHYQDFLTNALSACGMDSRLVQLPLKLDPVYGRVDGGAWHTFIQPSLVVIFMFILGNIPGVFIVLDKRQGVTDRASVAGIKYWHILVSSFCIDIVMIFAQTMIFFFILSTFYGMENQGDWMTAVSLVLLVGISGWAFGMLLGTVASHEMEVILVLLFINMSLIVSSGGQWPLEGVEPVYRAICLSSPTAIPLKSLRDILFKGLGLAHFDVLKGFAVSSAWVISCISLSILYNRVKK